MSQLELQTIAHCLAGAASAKNLDGDSINILYTQGSTIISKELTGKSFFNKPRVVDSGVRANSAAAYVLDKSVESVFYIDTSSRLRVVDFDEDSDEWYEDPQKVLHHDVHPSGQVAACFNGDHQIVVFFLSRRGTLTTFALTNPTSTVELPVRPAADTPLCAYSTRAATFVFYLSAVDQCIHCATKHNSNSGWVDKKWSAEPFKGRVRRFVINTTQAAGDIKVEAHVLTTDSTLLHVTPAGKWSKLGRIDGNGMFVSERSVDICCIEAQNNTLTEKRLGQLLAEDPSDIDAVGGPLSATPLATACCSGSLEAVDILLDNPYRLADPNALSLNNRTPLYYAVSRCPAANRKAIVSALLDAGAEVDACYPEDDLNTPLMNAIADTADKNVIHELIDRGASLTKRNIRGETAVMLAEGTGLEAELRPLKVREAKPHSVQKEVIGVLVAIAMLVMAYFNNQIVNDIVGRILSQLEESFGSDDKVDTDEAQADA